MKNLKLIIKNIIELGMSRNLKKCISDIDFFN